MWLPKDERKILSFYYQKTDAGSRSYSHISDESQPAQIPQISGEIVKQINKRLKSLGLIKTQIIDYREIKIELTREGLQLGRIYNSWWLSSKLWYDEYIKYHWICVIVGFLCGIISGLLIKLL
jgi:hypothetical protein